MNFMAKIGITQLNQMYELIINSCYVYDMAFERFEILKNS
jgi:hypothetical protein